MSPWWLVLIIPVVFTIGYITGAIFKASQLEDYYRHSLELARRRQNGSKET